MRIAELVRGLDEAAAGIAPADLDDARERVGLLVRHHRQRRAGAVALAVVVVLVVVTISIVSLSGGGQDSLPVVTDSTGVPHLVPTDVPERYVLAAVDSRPLGDSPTVPSARWTVWTDGDLHDPFGGDLISLQTSALGANPMADGDIRELEPGGEPLVAGRIGDKQFVLRAGVLNGDQLVELARSIVLDGDGSPSAISLPAGYRQVARVDVPLASLDVAPDAQIVVPDVSGYMERFVPLEPTTTTDFLEVGVLAVDRSWLWTLAVSPGITRTQVHGETAYRLAVPHERPELPQHHLLLWWADDGAMRVVIGPDPDLVQQLADSLEPADDQAWQDFVDSVQPVGESLSSSAGTELPATGTETGPLTSSGAVVTVTTTTP